MPELGRGKYALWVVMGCASISVLFYSEIPLLHKAQEQVQLHRLRWLLIPHAVAGTFAFLSGPAQFSSRLRRRFFGLHRVLGRMYVGAVFVAAPLAMVSTLFNHYPKRWLFTAAIFVQGGAWLWTTGVAFRRAVQRRIAEHREWMVRSYAVTFTFVGTRVLQPIPAWNRMGRTGFALAVVLIAGVAVCVPEIWRWVLSRVQVSGVRTEG